MPSSAHSGVRRVALLAALVGWVGVSLEGGAGCGRSDDVIGGSTPPPMGTGGAGGGAEEPQWRDDFEACAVVHDEATLLPVNMFLSVDKSGSMADNGKWDAATAAFTSFFNDPSASSLRVALRLWPLD